MIMIESVNVPQRRKQSGAFQSLRKRSRLRVVELAQLIMTELTANKKQVDNSRIATTATSAAAIRARYDGDVYALLMAIRGSGNMLRRTTLLRIADYRLAGAPVVRVFDRDDTSNESTHYRNLNKFPEYKAAHDALTAIVTDIVQQRSAAEIASATAVVSHTASRLGLLAVAAVDVLEDGLSAEKSFVTQNEDGAPAIETAPDYAERRHAANSILDRVPALAKNQSIETHNTESDAPLSLSDWRTQAKERRAAALANAALVAGDDSAEADGAGEGSE